MRCITENCNGNISPRSQLDRCAKCRANICGWRRKSPDQVLQRRKNLTMYADRMTCIGIKTTEKSNIVQFKGYAKKKGWVAGKAREKQKARR